MNSIENENKDEIMLRTSNVVTESGNGEAGEEKEVDLLELATKLWAQRKKLIKWSIVGAVIGVVVAFSIPREYDTSVKLAPEIQGGQKMSGGLASLASMAGINTNSQAGLDAVNPQLYPDVVSSVPFLVSLFNMPVVDIDGEKKMTLREYMEEETSSPWWSAVIGFPFKVLGALRGGEEDDDATISKKGTDPFQLTKKEDRLIEALRNRIVASVDAKTFVITISAKMQDPMVSALVADTVTARLQEYITDYRTNKARKDMEYVEKLNNEAKEAYYKAQQTYADYLDRNQGIILHSVQTTRERLENEATLAFNLYNQTSQQLQTAKAKVQESTPVYAVVNPATVPVKPSSPRKVMILIGFTFLAFVACAAWILYGKPMLEEMKQKKQHEVE